MRRGAIVVVILYGLIFILLTWPLFMIAFFPIEITPKTISVSKGVLFEQGKEVFNIFLLWRYWFLVLVLIISQYLLLNVPVQVVDKRPVTKKSLWFSVLASSLMMGLLAFGFISAIGELITKSPTVGLTLGGDDLGEIKTALLKEPLFQSALVGLIMVWLLWAFIFYRWSKNLKPLSFIEKQCRYLYRGSILELLVVVPTHIVARSRNYCCAGLSTFIGISFGLAVMLFSFGPAIFFLYLQRWEKLHPNKNGCKI